MENTNSLYKFDIQLFAGTDFVQGVEIPATTQLKVSWTASTSDFYSTYTPSVTFGSSALNIYVENSGGDAQGFVGPVQTIAQDGMAPPGFPAPTATSLCGNAGSSSCEMTKYVI